MVEIQLRACKVTISAFASLNSIELSHTLTFEVLQNLFGLVLAGIGEGI